MCFYFIDFRLLGVFTYYLFIKYFVICRLEGILVVCNYYFVVFIFLCLKCKKMFSFKV